MIHETDTRATAQLVQAQIVRIAVDDGAELVRELGDDVEHDGLGVLVAHCAAERDQLRVVLL